MRWQICGSQVPPPAIVFHSRFTRVCAVAAPQEHVHSVAHMRQIKFITSNKHTGVAECRGTRWKSEVEESEVTLSRHWVIIVRDYSETFEKKDQNHKHFKMK